MRPALDAAATLLTLRPSVSKPAALGRELLWLAAGIIVVSGVLVTMALIYLRTLAIESGERLTASFAQVIEEQTARTLQTIDKQLQLAINGYALLEASGDATSASMQKFFTDQMSELPFVSLMGVVDAEGRFKFASNTAGVGVNVIDRDYFQIYRTNPRTSFYVGKPLVSRINGKWTIIISRPMTSTIGAFAGVMVAALDLNYLDKLWRTVDVGEGGSIALFRRDGTLMARTPFQEAAMGKVFANGPIFGELFLKSASGVLQRDSAVDGKRRIFAYRGLSRPSDLAVIVGQSTDRVLAHWINLALLTLAVWLIASVAVFALCVLLHRARQARARIEARAEQSAERLSLATDAAAIGVWDWDLKKDEWYHTPTYFTMLGYAPDERWGGRERWLQRIHPDDTAEVTAKTEAMLARSPAPYQYEARVRHADGAYRWMSVIGRTLAKDESDNVTRIGGVQIDVHEHKLAEIASARLAAIVESSDDAIIGKDLNSIVTSWNRGAEKIFGYTAGEMVGTSIVRLIPADHIGEEVQILETIRRGESVEHFESVRQMKNGCEIAVSITASPIIDVHGRVIGVSKTARDITKHKAAELSLRESEGRYRALFEYAPYGIIIADFEGHLVDGNASLCRLLGYSLQEFVALHASDIVADSEIQHIAPALALIKSAADYQREWRFLRKNGTTVDAEVIATRMPDGNLVAMVRDITARKRAAEALRESEARYRELFESNPHPMWVFDTETLAFLAVNDAAIRHYGYSHDEFLSMTICDIRPADAIPVLLQHIHQVREGLGTSGVWQHVAKDGRHMLAEVSSHSLVFEGRAAKLILAHDVTARVTAEEQLRASEESLAITLHSIGDAVIATDVRGFITRMNAAAERMTGWPLAEATSRSLGEVFRIVNAQTRLESINPVQRVMERGEIVGLANHTVLLARDGKEYQISDSAAPIRNAEGGISGVVLVFSDVTEQYRVQQSLASTVELLERTGDVAKVGGWELDLSTMTPFWSLETARIHEVDPPVAPPLDQAIHFYAPEAQPVILSAVKAAIEDAKPWDLELPVITAKGRRIWVRTQGSAVTEHGKVVKLLGAFHDITERKLAEDALVETEARYRRIVNTAEEGIWMIDASALTSFVNPKMAQMLGYAEDEMFGRALIEFVDKDARAIANEIVLRRLPDISERHDFKFVRKDGGLLWGMVATNPIFDGSGHYAGALAMITDITARKNGEDSLRESLAEKEALLREVHHRVKNNLQVINSLLRLEIGRVKDSPAKSTLVDMQGRVQSMALLHETLYRAGTFAAIDLAVYLKQLVNQVYRALSINTAAVHVVFNLESVRVGMDQAVPCGLLVYELVSNALKHGFPEERSGDIRIDLRAIDDGSRHRLSVSDTGVGLSADFEQRRGRSLGLQLVSDLAMQLGGQLEIGPAPSARFIVTFTVDEP